MLNKQFEKSIESKQVVENYKSKIEYFYRVIGSTRVGVSWARTRTFGGRHRGGRGYASSSYRSSAGGGGGRRRSR